MIDRSRLLPADAHFNPSICRHRGELWMVYRRVIEEPRDALLEWPRLLAACRLGTDVQPVAASNIDLSARIVDPPSAGRWHADARITTCHDGLWMTYHDNHRMFATRLELPLPRGPLRPMALLLTGRRARDRERNWGLFDAEGLRAVYTINPHVVMRVTQKGESLEAEPAWEVAAALPWKTDSWGEPHGGSPPVRIGDCWFSFFHSSAPDSPGSDRRVYRVGFYGFAADPPHAIRYVTPEPIISGLDFPPPYSWFNEYAVAYPSGASFLDDTWIVSLGIHDRSLALLTIDHAAILERCEEVA
jgi:predicted GH43/DUF377 family glycosyl hydrolase